VSTTRAAGLGPDQRPGIVGGQTKVASSSKMDFDARYLLSVSSNFPPTMLSLGSETRSTNAKPIEFFANFCRMVGDEGAGSGGSHWTQPRTGTHERWSAAQ
jgi:hypothetical protein